MNCIKCPKNYLYKIYKHCSDNSEMFQDALNMFDEICKECKDNRNPIRIAKCVTEGICSECDAYRKTYEKYMKDHNI